MAVSERFAVREERVFFHRKVATPIASERHAIIEDCHGALYNNSTNVAADLYYGSLPQKVITTTTRPPPHQGQHFYPQTNIHRTANYNEGRHHDQQSQIMMQRAVNTVHMKMGTAVLTSTEAANLYGGVVITEFRTKKHEFHKKWIAACKNNTDRRSRVLIPPGTYKSGPAVFQGPCTCAKPIVQVLGTIKGLNDLSLYEEPYWFLFEKVEGLVITGNGVFDRQGSSAWKVAGDCGSSSDGCSPLPSSIKFNSVSNGVIRGISSLNSKGVHLFITDSQNVRVRRVNISAPGTSPNTDGIHISNSNNVKVARTHIATGDDCIGMIQGSTNIAINNVICGPGHGISVGSLGKYEHENDVKGITVKKTTFFNTDNGIRIKSWPGSGPSLASGMVFKDPIMQNVRNPIIIDQEYCAGGCDKNQTSRVQISNVHYINIKGTTPSNVAVDFICSSQVPCQNIQLHDIDLKYTGPNAAALTSVCKNVKAGFGGIQNPPACH